MDALNNAAITFNVSGTDKFISMWQAHKCAGEAQFRAPVEIKAGSVSYEYSPMGWGDYSGTSPDPIAPAIFWGHAQVPTGSAGPTDLWDTWISRRTLNCGLDVDGDGLVTALDFAAFTGLYAAGMPEADYKSDGVLNTQDVSAIQADLNGP